MPNLNNLTQDTLKNINFIAQKDITDIIEIIQESIFTKDELDTFLDKISKIVLQQQSEKETSETFSQLQNLTDTDLEIMDFLMNSLRG